jgi:hypothetical protein
MRAMAHMPRGVIAQLEPKFLSQCLREIPQAFLFFQNE